ncbi:unnamed protein product [Schistocephalus solidus]|uniref:Reverse transcriptase domain-containing protein n=1 Tax=Schistocephalus solidus TaxID=70667 RepID=A0A183TGY3_SCHSO|nr:unnamed protein product [Schistocephalus solidus]
MLIYLYSTFFNLTNVFDTVNHEGLGKIIQKFGCPKRFTHIERNFHDGMMLHVTDNGAISEAFEVTTEFKLIHTSSVICSLPCKWAPSVTNATESASPTEWTANYSIVGGCTSRHMYQQRLSTNFPLPTITLKSMAEGGHAREHETISRPLREFRPDSKAVSVSWFVSILTLIFRELTPSVQ